MDNPIKITALLLTIVIVAVAFVMLRNNGGMLGSVTQGNEYNSTQITSSTASATAITQIKSRAGTLGSVIITDEAGAVTNYNKLVIYDATSTTHATTSATVLAKFSTTTADYGVYTFDTVFNNGLYIEVPPSFDGIYTLTWR